jgi:hypothetical protein
MKDTYSLDGVACANLTSLEGGALWRMPWNMYYHYRHEEEPRLYFIDRPVSNVYSFLSIESTPQIDSGRNVLLFTFI